MHGWIDALREEASLGEREGGGGRDKKINAKLVTVLTRVGARFSGKYICQPFL